MPLVITSMNRVNYVKIIIYKYLDLHHLIFGKNVFTVLSTEKDLQNNNEDGLLINNNNYL